MPERSEAEVVRRARHDELNRSLILDAAEEVFAGAGFAGGSLRAIAAGAGFSVAALYLYFDSKADLYAQMLVRRGVELIGAMAQAAEHTPAGIARLHAMADAAIATYRTRPNFARLVAQAHAARLGSPLGGFAEGPDEEVRAQYERAMALEVMVIVEGQALGQIRAGDPHALAHLFSVLVNSYLAVGASEQTPTGTGGLTVAELHGIIDGAFRPPTTGPGDGQ